MNSGQYAPSQAVTMHHGQRSACTICRGVFNSVMASKPKNGILYPRIIPTSAFSETMFHLLGWNIDYKYRILGTLYEQDAQALMPYRK